MQFSLDSKTGQPVTSESAAPAETPAPPAAVTDDKSQFERELEAVIQDNPAVLWLREHPVVYHASAAGATLLVAALLYVALRTAVFLPILRFLRGHGDGDARGANLLRAIRESGMLNPLAWILPFLVAWRGIHLWPGLIPSLAEAFGRVMLVIAIAFGLMAFARVLSAVDILVSLRFKRPGALRGYVQAISAIIYVVGGITLIAILLGRSPLLFLTGVGAFAAVLAVVLKDTLVSMLANILMTTGDTLRVGDWIELKPHGVDGRVEAIALTSTRVRNWDETIVTIPNSRFISEIFVNYRTGDPRGGRRIRRTLRIDQRSVRSLDASELATLAQRLESPTVAARARAIAERAGGDASDVSNLCLLRAYVEEFLEGHAKIDRARPVLVRQHEPTPTGTPVEVLAFLHDCDIAGYEATQAAILDHLVSTLPKAGLRLFQGGPEPVPAVSA
ncbi:MAG: mechanosensitive ion channel family protein [Phycisphaerae bacterium]|nr:mechanosensitive ion channel family protein [Phycisphaerae bacterium]